MLAGAVACGGSDTAPNGMTANDILAMCHNASASINTSQLYTTKTFNNPNFSTTINSFTSKDRFNHTSFHSENTSMTSKWWDNLSMTLNSETYKFREEIYIFNNSLYVYKSAEEINISKWIRTESTVDLWWDEEDINSLYQECVNQSADADYMGNEIVREIDCYKIGFTHDLSAIADILRYFNFNTSGIDSGLDNGNISNLECTIYVDRNTYYPIKVSLISNLMIDNFIANMSDVKTLSSINQPVSIVLPEAAINATFISYSDYVSGNWSIFK